jgi:DNA repair protein RecO (recombination protein O)
MKKMTAVVLRVNDHGESDKIVTFYSREAGKIAGIAKGAKKSKKRFSNKLEIFSLLEVLYDDRSRSGLVRISEAELVTPFLRLRENYDRYVGAVLACELIYYWSRDYDADRNIFNLLVWALQSIDNGRSSRLIHIFFQVKLYTFLGYRLHIDNCIKCRTADQKDAPYAFYPGRHGLLCRNCTPQFMSRDMVPLAINTIKLLQHAQDLSLEKLDRLRFSAASIREALQLFKIYGQYLLQCEIPAWDFLLEEESRSAGVNPDK